MNVFVTGAAGHLGAAIVQEFGRHADVIALTRAELDITEAAAVSAAVAAAKPNVVINCAAYNDVDAAEDDPVTAFAVNAFGVQALARASHAHGSVFVHFSSDFVFNGESTRPYTESDRPGPLSVYGASKLVGEWFARDAERYYLLRVESLFGGPTAGTTARSGSVGRIVDAIEADAEVPVFVDRVVSPTHVVELAEVTRRLVASGVEYGLFHAVNSGSCRWDELALEVGRLLGRTPRLKPLTLESVALRARRPRFCALDNGRLAEHGFALGHWRDAVEKYVRTRTRS